MKRLFLILMVATLSVAAIATSTKNGAIRTGFTMLSQPMKFTDADSLAGNGGHHIMTGDSIVILISNPQVYLQYHVFTSTLAVYSGSGTVTITARGKVNSGDAWSTIGSAGTFTTGVTPVTITGTTAKNYNFLRVSYVQSGGTENAIITAFDVKTANAFPYGATIITGTAGATVTGGVVSLNASSNNAVNIGTGTTTSTVTLGGTGAQTIAVGNGAAAKTVAIGSSNTTSTTTILSGSGGLLLNKDNNQPTNIGTGTSTGLVTIGGGSGTAAINTTSWDISNAGAATGFTGFVTTGVLSGGALVTSGIDTCLGSQEKSVAGISLLRVTNTSTIKGLSGGVTGQFLRIINTSATTLTVKHNTGTQKIMVSGGSDASLTGQYNGLTLVFDGTNWYITGKGQ
jgi:hypothetical protein